MLANPRTKRAAVFELFEEEAAEAAFFGGEETTLMSAIAVPESAEEPHGEIPSSGWIAPGGSADVEPPRKRISYAQNRPNGLGMLLNGLPPRCILPA